jgi:hypothetical protein
MNNQFEVVQATTTSKNNVCVKLQNKTEVKVTTAFGDAISNQQTTYYVFMSTAPAIGLVAPLDVALFDIKEKEHTMTDGTVVTLKYLYPKK